MYTLQLLHLSDGEAGVLAPQTAPNFAALVDAFEDKYVNSITLAGGDNFIPGPFFAAGAEPTITAIIPNGAVQGRPDIAILNAIGVQASAIGNHEFDFGSAGFSDAFRPAGTWVGAQFAYLSSNLDFSGDAVLNPAFVNTLATPGLEEASANKGKIVPSAIITEGGERIGVIGITTQLLEQLSSPTGTEVKGFPTGPGPNGEIDDMVLLASQVQVYIDDLIAQGVNKIVLLSHLQLLSNEAALAPLLTGVDIILAAGSHSRLGDADDVAAVFPGHAADFVDTYPIVTAGADGVTTVIVGTDGEFTYLGRLVVDFDDNGAIIVDSLTANVATNGAYAATTDNVAKAWNDLDGDLSDTAFAEGTRGETVQDITEAVRVVIEAKNGNIYGYSDVYLEGGRAKARTEETNLGNVSADANADAARDALGLTSANVIVSLKNGGGIRAQIGTVNDIGNGAVEFAPNPGGVVSQLDVENALRFNNALVAFDTTAQGLLNILNNPAALTPNNGGFMQIGGLQVSYDPTAAAGSRVRDIVLVDEAGNKVAAIVDDGVVVPGAPAVITMVALNFTAIGGDGYPIPANAFNYRFLLNDGTISAPVPLSQLLTPPANVLTEQKAFEDYFRENFSTPEKGFDIADTTQAGDLRIQNQAARDDTVLDDFGSDKAFKGSGAADAVFLGTGNNVARGFGGDDAIAGGDGNDRILGGTGNDKLLGGTGNDNLNGEADSDNLSGGTGDDRLFGGDGSDIVKGGDGNDVLYGDNAGDRFDHEGFADTFVFDAADGRDKVFDFESGIDHVELAGGTDYSLVVKGGNTTLSFGTTTVVFYDEVVTTADILLV